MTLAVLLNTLTLCLLGQQPYDLILKGGRIVDGSGNPWYRADIGVRAGRIATIGNLTKAAARRTIALNGEMVAPGFIDMMGTNSIPLLLDPASGDSKLRQGITTIMAGEGQSAAPMTPDIFPADIARAGYKWSTYADYHALLARKGLPLNVVHNVGAAQIRRAVIGEEDRLPTPAELDRMRQLVRKAMADGAVGLSTALIYPPGTYAKTEELVELAKATAAWGGFYSTHMRNESSQVLHAIRESIEIGEKAGVPVHIYHLKAAGEENWPLMSRAIALINDARRRGLDVTADIYPYIRNGIGLRSFIPPHHYAKGLKPFFATLREPQVRAALRKEIETDRDWENWYQHVGRNWDNVLVAQLPAREDKLLEGKSVAEIARIWLKDDWDAFFDLVLRDANVNPKSMNEEQKHMALRTEWVSFCTDAPPANIETATGAHPRAFGSFPRILAKYVREEKVISVEAAIRKMSSLAANRLRLLDRGRIAPGMAADLVVFDPDRVQDKASFTKPLAFPEGLPYVIVNGVVAIDQDKSTGARAGKVLKPLLAAAPATQKPAAPKPATPAPAKRLATPAEQQ
ncbi:MAG: D-aminoacylase [Bryobacterales bacterium]|nr:D-aminoacylase [Bryobacterales bacterium]